ncbi:MAG: hypothetical protein ABR564_02710 [Candidatus Dormibacteria bacterium]
MVVAILIGAYVGGSTLSGALTINPTDLDAFFLPSARTALSGHPLDVYGVRHDGLYPNANGPLSLIPLTAAAAVAQAMGLLGDLQLRRALIMGVFSIFALLMAREAVLAIDRLRGTAVSGGARIVFHGVFAASPLVWQSVLLYGHIEQPLCLWLTLRGIRSLLDGRARRGGVLLGLAVLSRTVEALLLLPLVGGAVVRRRAGEAGGLAGFVLLTVSVGLAPFLLARGGDTLFSLVTFRAGLPVGGGSIWYMAGGTPIEWWAQRVDGIVVLVAVCAVTGIVLRRRPQSASAPQAAEIYGLLAISAMCFPLFAKTVWPYYLLDVYVLFTIWAVGAWRRPLARGWYVPWLVPGLLTACGLTAELGVTTSLDAVWRRLEGLAMFAVLGSLAAASVAACRLSTGRRSAAAGSLDAPV